MAGSRIKGITVEIGGDTSGLEKALSDINKSIKTTESSLRDVNKLLKLDPTNTQLLAQKHKLLQQEISDTEDKLKTLKNADKQAKAQLEAGDLGQDKYDALQREIIDTEEKLKSLKKTAGSGFDGLNQLSIATGRVSEKTGQLADKTKPATVAITALGVASVKMASDFEAGMDEVLAISGATAEEFEQLKDKAVEMGAKTKFSATDSADAFKYMAMAGWDATAMLDGIEGIMNLAAASGEDLATTSDIVTDALTAFGLKAEDSAHFADVLAMASSKSNTNVGLMGETFKYVAPVAGSLGYSIEDTAVAIGLMANAGIKGNQAGTALRTLLTNMAKPTDDMAVAMEELGVSLEDGEGNMLSLAEVIEQLRGGFGDLIIPQEEFTERLSELDTQLENGTLTEKQYGNELERLVGLAYGAEGAEKAKYAAMLAGKEGMSALLAIVNASTEDYSALTAEINNASGAAENMAGIMMDNTAGSIEQLQGALESAAIIIGERLSPYIRQLAEFVTGLVEKFNSLSDEQLDMVVKIGVLIAAISPLLLIISKVTGVISTITGAMSKMSFAGGALVKAVNLVKTALSVLFGVIKAHPVIAVATAIIAILVTLYNKCAWFRDGVHSILNAVGSFFTWLGGIIGNMASSAASTISSMVSSVTGFFSNLRSSATQIWNNIKASVISTATSMKTNVTTAFSNMVSGIRNTISKITSVVKSGFQGAINYIKGLPGQAIGWGSDFIDGMAQGIRNAAGRVISAAQSIAGSIASFLHFSRPDEGPLHYYEQWMPDFISGMAKGIKENIPQITTAVNEVANAMKINPDVNMYATPASQNISVNAPAVTVMIGNKQFDGYIVQTAQAGMNEGIINYSRGKGAL